MKRFIFFISLLLSSFGYTTSAAALPDVIVTQLSYANGIFTSTIVNQSATATPAGVTVGVGYLVDGVQKTYGYVIGPLAAGASVAIGTNGGPYTIPTGTHTITAYVDDVNRFAESNETNNQLSSSISNSASSSLPDIIVTQLSYANGIFTSTIKNQGTAATPAGVTIGVGYLVDDVHKTYGYVIGPLAAGAAVAIGTNGGSYTIPTGTHTITAYADDLNRVAESNKTNNQLSKTNSQLSPVTVGAVPQTAISVGGIASPARLDSIKAMGAKWVRFDLTWNWVMGGGPNTYDWSGMDSQIQGIVSRGMKPLATLQRTPAWARPADCTFSELCAPANANDFANFANAAAKRYPQIQVWEIWNEPNLIPFWKPKPDAVKYTSLLKAAYIAIKAVNPNAIVLTGGTAPAGSNGTDISPIDFLQAIYNNGGGGSFDGVAHHPYCYDVVACPDFFATWSAWSQMNDTFPSLRSVMIDHGDDNKKIWGTEFGAPTGGTKAVTEAQQAQIVTNAYNSFRSYDWAGPVFAWHNDQDICTDSNNIECFFGLKRYDGSNKPGYNAFVAAGIP